MAKISTKDWRNLPIENWNTTTFTQYLVDHTQEKFGVPYAPGGHGSKNARWMMEKGMLKRAQTTYGSAVLRRFIEICQREYRTNKPDQFPYPTFAFMVGYMDRFFINAELELNREAKRKQSAANIEQVDTEELADWF